MSSDTNFDDSHLFNSSCDFCSLMLQMAMSILFCTKKRTPTERFCEEGGKIFYGGDLSMVVRKGCYVAEIEICDFPIGRDDRDG